MKHRLRKAVAVFCAAAFPLVARAQLQTVTPFGGQATGGIFAALMKVINALLAIAAIAAIIFIIVAGIRLIVSAGDEDQVAKGKRGILYAVIGLIVIILAFAIINFLRNVLGR